MPPPPHSKHHEEYAYVDTTYKQNKLQNNSWQNKIF
jgi:hypothetical protein